MTVTTEQQQAIDSGQPVSLVLGNTPCIVIRKDVFERVSAAAGQFENGVDPRASYSALLRAWDLDKDPNELGLASYQQYKRKA